MQSCQPLRLGRSLLHLRELHYAATLMIISLLSPPEKIFSISCMRVGLKCTNMCLFCVCGVGCATASRCSCFKPADQS